MSPRKRHNFKAARRGAVVVEFAVTSGLAFFFFFAALEFSRVAMIRHTLDNAIYEGARQGITPGATTTEVEEAVANMLRSVGVRNATVSVTPTPIRIDSPTITVRVQLPLDGNMFAPSRFFRGAELDRSLTLDREIP